LKGAVKKKKDKEKENNNEKNLNVARPVCTYANEEAGDLHRAQRFQVGCDNI
jgi:hypothetical protein